MRIARKQIEMAIIKALSKTYVKALTKETPGDGETHNNWDIKIEGSKITIFNAPTGDNVLFTNDGREPGEIHAKPGKWLKFKASGKPAKPSRHKIKGNRAFEKDGYIFAKAVYHPGIQAQHYIERIMEDKSIENEARKILEAEIEKLLPK